MPQLYQGWIIATAYCSAFPGSSSPNSHLHIYANSSSRTPQHALCDPRKTMNWHLCDVVWRTLAKGILLQLHQCCGTTYHYTSNDPRPWTFLSLVLRLICYNLHILRDFLQWICECCMVLFHVRYHGIRRFFLLLVCHAYIHFSACEQGSNIHMEYLSHFESSAL